MPHLTSKALTTDPDGLAFLRDVLRPQGQQPARTGLRLVASAPTGGHRPAATTASLGAVKKAV